MVIVYYNSDWKIDEQYQDSMETFGDGDSYLIRDARSTDSNDDEFAALLQEIEWCEMFHRGSPGIQPL